LDSTYNRKIAAFLGRHRAELDSLIAVKAPTYVVNEFLSKKYPQEADSLRAPLSLLIDHIDYIVKLIGVDHVGLGSDFDGIESPPKEMDDVTTYPLITRELLRRGYKKADVEKVLGGNFIRVFRANAGSGGAAVVGR
jgi:membrane dipeptidase